MWRHGSILDRHIATTREFRPPAFRASAHAPPLEVPMALPLAAPATAKGSEGMCVY